MRPCLMNDTSRGNDEKVGSRIYIKKGFWVSLGAASGIGLAGLVVMGIGEISIFIGNIPTAYTVLTKEDDEYCKQRYCKTTFSQRLQDAYSVFQLCRKDSICIWKQ